MKPIMTVKIGTEYLPIMASEYRQIWSITKGGRIYVSGSLEGIKRTVRKLQGDY
jgi:hypothetical protein